MAVPDTNIGEWKVLRPSVGDFSAPSPLTQMLKDLGLEWETDAANRDMVRVSNTLHTTKDITRHEVISELMAAGNIYYSVDNASRMWLKFKGSPDRMEIFSTDPHEIKRAILDVTMTTLKASDFLELCKLTGEASDTINKGILIPALLLVRWEGISLQGDVDYSNKPEPDYSSTDGDEQDLRHTIDSYGAPVRVTVGSPRQDRVPIRAEWPNVSVQVSIDASIVSRGSQRKQWSPAVRRMALAVLGTLGDRLEETRGATTNQCDAYILEMIRLLTIPTLHLVQRLRGGSPALSFSFMNIFQAMNRDNEVINFREMMAEEFASLTGARRPQGWLFILEPDTVNRAWRRIIGKSNIQMIMDYLTMDHAQRTRSQRLKECLRLGLGLSHADCYASNSVWDLVRQVPRILAEVFDVSANLEEQVEAVVGLIWTSYGAVAGVVGGAAAMIQFKAWNDRVELSETDSKNDNFFDDNYIFVDDVGLLRKSREVAMTEKEAGVALGLKALQAHGSVRQTVTSARQLWEKKRRWSRQRPNTIKSASQLERGASESLHRRWASGLISAIRDEETGGYCYTRLNRHRWKYNDLTGVRMEQALPSRVLVSMGMKVLRQGNDIILKHGEEAALMTHDTGSSFYHVSRVGPSHEVIRRAHLIDLGEARIGMGMGEQCRLREIFWSSSRHRHQPVFGVSSSTQSFDSSDVVT